MTHAPQLATLEGLTAVVSQLAITVQQLAEVQCKPIQVTSTPDTAAALPKFSGEKLDDPETWTNEVERVAAQANWSPNLTLLNAVSRLSGLAANWQKTCGKQHSDWAVWKSAFLERFKRRLSMEDFIDIQAKRTLRRNETIVQYIFEKDALLEMSPHPLTAEERISMIIGDIKDNVWAIPLASHTYSSVTQLVDRAASLDSIRQVDQQESKPEITRNQNRPQPSRSSQTTHAPYLQKYNPTFGDRPENLSCWRCGKRGHISYQCHLPAPQPGTAIVATPDIQRESPRHPPQRYNKDRDDTHDINSSNQQSKTPPQSKTAFQRQPHRETKETSKQPNSNVVNCVFADCAHMPIVNAIINGSTTIDALCDPGSQVTLIRECMAPSEIPIHERQNGPLETAGGNTTPSGWITLRIKVGNIDYVMPRVGLCKKLPVALILGNDWKSFVHARYIFEPDGSLCISTPSSIQEYQCIKPASLSINCVFQPENFSRTHDVSDNPPYSISSFAPSKANAISSSQDCSPQPTSHIEQTTHMDMSIRNKVSISKSLSSEQEEQVGSLVDEFADIFSLTTNVGYCPYVELDINLSHDRPVRCQPYRLSQPDRQFSSDQVNIWRQQGICRPSTSAYASPAFIVEQPFHETTPRRLVVDYSRTINPITIADPQPVDCMDDVLSTIAGCRFMSNMDIKSAFFTTKVKEEDVHKTAFVTQDHHDEFLRMPFGLKNGPPTMTRAIKMAYARLRKLGVVTYVDDIACAHDSFEQHIHCLREIFLATRTMGFTLSPGKCIFASSTINLLGRVITPEGILPDSERAAAVSRYSTLTSLPELRSFLGFANTFRKHIEHFATIAKPLTELLKTKGRKTNESDDLTTQPHIVLDAKQQSAFDTLKAMITSPPLLAFFKQGCPTFVETDASHKGLGACLSQTQGNARRVIEYASRSLKDPEQRYHINELECTAVHWAVTDKFRLYLHGHKFTLLTDNFTIAYVVNKAKINRKFARYTVDLAAFEFTAVHRAGKENVIADHLSRFPQPQTACLAVIVSQDSELIRAQQADEYCRQIFEKLSKQPDTHHLRQVHDSFNVSESVLLHVTNLEGHKKQQIVVPFALRSTVLRLCHDDAGHLSDAKTLERVRSKYWWSSVRQDVRAYTPEQFFNKYGIQHRLSPPYTPQANGLVERANATLVTMLKKLSYSNPKAWDKALPHALLAINTAVQSSTGLSPFYLLHGYQPRLPQELSFGTLTSDETRENQLDLKLPVQPHQSIWRKHTTQAKQGSPHAVLTESSVPATLSSTIGLKLPITS
ncbi:uncharacterized protein LOC135394440 [Ornithodoros turicata]|uniref:uncharacterized protein LOC135394440 n=1 Tax=Ornithodoros turicata TaxID=34597 RepID=UPI003139ABDC